ncbi:hypothetical protein THIOM_002316 [Candidatus Thiomargarita nelsonii]|uniref:Uncharacterized protein n=1 Tax=Candidatus Thiomargarita nelsonii TaxID=1003181 RepID=A0A176S1V5_9GAMM|nr:hypothetical protein THIOM_002316 [Candidatus Thiomargarita nelsonii]
MLTFNVMLMLFKVKPFHFSNGELVLVFFDCECPSKKVFFFPFSENEVVVHLHDDYILCIVCVIQLLG